MINKTKPRLLSTIIHHDKKVFFSLLLRIFAIVMDLNGCWNPYEGWGRYRIIKKYADDNP